MKKTAKRAISALLLVLMLTSMFSITVMADNGPYFDKYEGKSYSIVDALHAVGAQYSYAYRKTIAAANGIQGYRGTAQQNLQMVELLKAGKLIKPVEAEATSGEALPGCYKAYKGKVTGLVQALDAVGAPIAFAHRAKIAVANDIVKKVEDYKGTYTQNAAMLDLLVKGQLKAIEL